jgi:hypothetical protein
MQNAAMQQVLLNKEQVMEALQLKERTVQKLGADGVIKTVKVDNGQTGHKVLMFHAESVAAYIKAKNTPSTATAVTTRKDASVQVAPLQTPKDDKGEAGSPWLSATEAGALVGLPAHTIDWLRDEGFLRAVNAGLKTVRWRYHREELLAFRGVLLRSGVPVV